MNQKKIIKIAITAMMIAICYVGSNFIKFDIPTPFGSTKFHLGNTFCILSSLILGGVYGGLAGAIGMSIGDLFDPLYVASAPKTMITKFIIGFIAGTLAHKVFKINDEDNKSNNLKIFLSCAIGAFSNVLVEPCISYLYYKFILGLSEKAVGAFTGLKFLTSTTNAVLASIIAPLLYISLLKIFKNDNRFKELSN